MPRASKCNEKVAMDLKQWNGRWILHIIDMWSSYTLSVFVGRKKPGGIIDALMTQWTGQFGVMKALMTDNSGEFNSDEMRVTTFILTFNSAQQQVTVHFKAGLCERVHAITDMMLVKLAADYGNVNSQTLLSCANMARNSLQMWNGYSSHQLIFGENPNLPNIMSNTLPALERTTSSEVFAQHLNALRGACKAFRLNDGPDIKLFILVGLGRSFFVCCLAHRGSTVGFLLLQCSSGVVRHPSDLQVSVATRFCRVLIFASS